MRPALVVATIRFKDKERYKRYADAFPGVFANSGGVMLAADDEPVQRDGDQSGVDKVVVIRFETAEAAAAFLNSAEYAAISQDRDAGADVTSWIVKGY